MRACTTVPLFKFGCCDFKFFLCSWSKTTSLRKCWLLKIFDWRVYFDWYCCKGSLLLVLTSKLYFHLMFIKNHTSTTSLSEELLDFCFLTFLCLWFLYQNLIWQRRGSRIPCVVFLICRFCIERNIRQLLVKINAKQRKSHNLGSVCYRPDK